ncbi:M12 family metallopeptidase [Tepidibacter aestuarii]|uniref:M12 family metallopeptidase n=1 Tax=Tepidibacter aestuarii TaxID=2925782 RepID=UPI0020C01B33|nr:M12 family metallopeptidase [Tepidibacter aestuarii]CAH2213850.1 ZnMc domain-containing protein [Tepidibacter aestuarii]
MTEEKKITNYCSMPVVSEREFGVHVNPYRRSLIRILGKKWVNGTVLHYYFFDKETDGAYVDLTDGSREWRTWTTSEEEKNVVRNAFSKWKDIGIGLEFKEVATRDEAEVRIGFMRGDGAWSYLGRDIIDLNLGKDERTMNFGWDLTHDEDTAMHEIGHTLGFPHEHQNPKAGIVWNEQAVYTELASPPNYWSPEKTYYNIIRKIDSDTIQGSKWDPNSIMHYPFGPGLIISPEQYKNGIYPKPGLSEHDKEWVRKFYPPLDDNDLEELPPFASSKLMLNPGEQKNFIIKPSETRKYNIATFGKSDSVIILLEKNDNGELYIAGDDDSGEDYNASMNLKLYRGKKYILRVRLYYRQRAGETAVMYW